MTYYHVTYESKEYSNMYVCTYGCVYVKLN